MSSGSKIVPVRFPEPMLLALQVAMDKANETRKDEPYDMSSFIRHAVSEKLAKLHRGRRKSTRQKALAKIKKLPPTLMDDIRTTLYGTQIHDVTISGKN